MSIHPALVAVTDAHKRYGGAQALAGVSVEVRGGEILALVGENGAGKSTLGKIIAGVVAPDEGGLAVDGRAVRFRGPRDALAHGIAIVEQELALVPAMTARENALLAVRTGRGRAAVQAARDRIEMVNADFGLAVALDTPVEQLTLVEQQKVEILRALVHDARVVVMDEPTARLPAAEARALLRLMRRIAAEGTAIVFVSHFLEEVLAVADRITIMRDGAVVATRTAAESTVDDLIGAMLGRAATVAFPPKRRAPVDAPVALTVDRLSGPSGVDEVSFTVAAGEIVALAGLVGSGRTEVARMLFGADPRSGGTATLDGQPLAPRSPGSAIKVGVAYVPESRKDQGLFLTRPGGENVTLSYLRDICHAGFIARGTERREAQTMIDRVGVVPRDQNIPVRMLSGGNQQKVLFAKWLWQRPRLLIVDEPTRGVDVGAKLAIYELLVELAASGLPILMISSEVEEVLGLAHRVVVLHRGRSVATLDGDEAGEDAILRAAFGEERQRAEAAA